MSVRRVSRTQGEIKRLRQARNGDLIEGDVGVNESTTVSSAWELTSVSMHYSQGNGVYAPLSRLVLYPRLVCQCVYLCWLLCVCGVPTARLCAVKDDNNKDMCVNHL